MTVQTNPLGQTCTVSNGSGVITDNHITSVLISCSTNSGVIVTVAGGGSSSPGDVGAATNAQLNYPRGIAVDSSGNLYIADDGNHRIRKVDTNGIITTVAGTGSSGFSGDGGAATNAQLNYPLEIAVDSSGNLYCGSRMKMSR